MFPPTMRAALLAALLPITCASPLATPPIGAHDSAAAIAGCTPGTKYCIDDLTIGTCASDGQTLINAERCKHYCARPVINGEEQGLCAILIDGPDPGYTPTPRPTSTLTGIIPTAPPRL